MKSHRCTKPRGVGSAPAMVTPAPAPSALPHCQYVSARGQRCRLFSRDASGFCAHHARQRSRRESRIEAGAEAGINKATATELLASIEDFSSPEAVNLFLGNVVKQLVRKRISRRDAIALAYLSQLLLNSLSAIGREERRDAEQRPKQPPVIVWDGVFAPDFGREKPAAAEKNLESAHS